MGEPSGRRIAAIAAIAGALVGAVAGALAGASASGSSGGETSSGGVALSTAAVVRTTLTNAEQVGGSISYGGSYTIDAPSGYDAQQVALAEQALARDQMTLTSDQQAERDTAATDNQAVVTAQGSVTSGQSALGSDQAAESVDCAGSAASDAVCASASQKVSQDQAQLAQATQQLDAAQSTATRDDDQSQAKVALDQSTVTGDQATAATDQATALNPGTTYTSLPKAGDVIEQDQSVYALDNEPVLLLYGPVPAYRAFYAGMSDGADVGELTADLIALGYGTGLPQSNHYSSATAAAVGRWQRALGLPATGEILLGSVVFEPGPIRVTAVTPSVGASLGGGGGESGGGGGSAGGNTVLTATSTTPVVTVDLPVTQEYEVKVGDTVSVVLPDGTSTVGGRVETVGTVAVCQGGGGVGGGTGASISSSAADQSTCSSGGSGAASTPTVTVTITLGSTPTLATLDQAPVNVDITSQKAVGVLAVPVNALLALQGGGFGVDVVRGNGTRLVGVTTGIYTRNLVQVSGVGIAVGTRVQVPSS